MSTPLTVAWLRAAPLEMTDDEAVLAGVLAALAANRTASETGLRLASQDIGGPPSYNGSPIINAAFPDTFPGGAALRQKLKAWSSAPPAAAPAAPAPDPGAAACAVLDAVAFPTPKEAYDLHSLAQVLARRSGIPRHEPGRQVRVEPGGSELGPPRGGGQRARVARGPSARN